MITTPANITRKILELCKKLNPNTLPVYVPVQPAAGAIVNECFPNVQSKIEKDGGTIAYGWQIWERPNVFIEGEFHAVWVSPSDEYIDITPKQDGEKTILFLPDPSQTFTGKRLANVRFPLQDNPLIHEFLSVTEAIARVRAKYSDGKFGEISIPKSEIMPLLMQQAALDLKIQQRVENSMSNTIGRNDPCPCNSGKKYKKCCGI